MLQMYKDDRPEIIVDRKKEMRTLETSRMINEGGLGSRIYYNIEKVSKPEREIVLQDNELERS